MQSKVLVVPAGKEFSGTLPDGGKGLDLYQPLRLVSAPTAARPTRDLDGLETTQGLSVGLFVASPGLCGPRETTPGAPDNAKRGSAAPHELGFWHARPGGLSSARAEAQRGRQAPAGPRFRSHGRLGVPGDPTCPPDRPFRC